MERRRAAIAFGLALGFAGVLAPATGASGHGIGDRFTYARSQPNLCRNINNAVHVHPVLPYRVTMPLVKGTRDFTESGGYSLRTCDWKAKAGYVDYVCQPPPRGAVWRIAITRRSELHRNAPSSVVYSKMVCDGKWKRVVYSWSARDSTHVHLWAPSENAVLRGVVVSVPRAR